jgi:hypothetical protein
VRSRVGRVLAAVAVVGAVVSGCGAGPSQVGSAAIVGSEAVPLDRVQDRLDVALARTDVLDELAARGLDAPDIARDVVTQAVTHDLFQRAAAAEGITVTESDVDTALAERGGAEAVLERSLFDLPAVRERIADELVAERLGARFVDRLAVTVDILGVTSEEEAAETARVLAVGGPAADALFDANPQTSRRGVDYRASTAPEVAATVLFGTAAGRAGYFQPAPGQSGWIVFRVLERSTDAPAVGPEAATRVGSAELVGIGRRLLQPLAAELGVRVNPRYGVWDEVTLRVVGEDELAGSVLPPTAG